MDRKPLVSVITPFYNTSPDYFEGAIRGRVRTNLRELGAPGISVLVPPENQGLFQEALWVELSKNKDNARRNQVARNYAERYLASDGILSHFEKVLSAGVMP
jgi:hypothetical protein